MIEIESAQEQLYRFAGYRNFPNRHSANIGVRQDALTQLGEAARALAKVSATEDDCRLIVDGLLERCQAFPTIAEIVAVGRSSASEYVNVDRDWSAPPKCQECGDLGFITVRKAMKLRTRHEYQADIAYQCRCRGGRGVERLAVAGAWD